MSAQDFDINDPNPSKVPNYRGGPSMWLVFILGPLLAAIVTAVGAVWVIARMPDGPRFDRLSNDVASIKQDVAVSKAHEEGRDREINLQFENIKLLIKQTDSKRRP